jgi:hypothetical protein
LDTTTEPDLDDADEAVLADLRNFSRYCPRSRGPL